MVHLANAAVVCPERFPCRWVQNGIRHRPHRGLTKDLTKNGNARYLPGTTLVTIEAIERTTAAHPTALISPPPAAEYLRETGQVIGWDRGLDATLSFVECTSRSFHGRPMAPGNDKLRGVR
ncbi:MAG: hypothetical protein ACREJ3_15435 [Polyangiaceae bacterium]